MSITKESRKEIERSIRKGLKALERPEPLRLSQWAAQNFYLSKESSYTEQPWEAWPFQPAIMDCMSNDDIRIVSVKKSARVGYTKMFVAVIGYNAEHKRRNTVVFQPSDGDAEDFVKDEIDPMLRDVIAVQRVFPHSNTKSKYNTLSRKQFTGSTLDIRGGKAAKNYRRLTKDVACYDELSGFDQDIEREGSPTRLGDKRIEGATFPKSIRGSTPKIAGECLIDASYQQADVRFTFHVPCPHCGHEQDLKWGGEDASFGLKWTGGDPSTAVYQCAGCPHTFSHAEYLQVWGRGRWIGDDGTWIDGESYFRASNGDVVAAPRHVGFHIWTAYALTGWEQIVSEFLEAKNDPSLLKTFVNTTLGETWEEGGGEKTDAELLMRRREHYRAEAPSGVQVVVASIDTQDDRFEIQFDGYGYGEERWTLALRRLYGDPSRPEIWDRLATELQRPFRREDGTILTVILATQDHGGHYSDEVNKFSIRMGVKSLVPIKGSSLAGKPVAVFPREKNANGVYLTMVGTDTAKSNLYQRYQIDTPGPGYVHWPIEPIPNTDPFDRTYFDQVTAEKRKTKYVQGKPVLVWDSGKRRNEATDLSVYSLAAIRIVQQVFGLDLTPPRAIDADPSPRRQRRRVQSKYVRS